MLVLARGLSAGRRLARHLVRGRLVIGLGASAFDGVVPNGSASHRPARWVLGIGALAALLVLRHDFPTLPHPKRVRASMRVAAFGVGIFVVHTGWLAIVARSHPSTRAAALPVEAAGGVLGLVVAGSTVAALAVALSPAPAPAPDT